MSSYSGLQLLKDRDLAAKYFASVIRLNLLGYIVKIEGKYPWDNEVWQVEFPILSSLMTKSDEDFPISEDIYFNMLDELVIFFAPNPWLIEGIYESLDRNCKRYFLRRRYKLKNLLLYFVVFVFGLLIGGIVS